MIIKKRTSKYDIIDSGTIINFDNESDIFLDIECDEVFTVTLDFHFDTDSTNASHIKTKISEDSENTIIFNCFNFNNPVGTGLTKPMPIAFYEGRNIYLNLQIYSLCNDTNKKIEYCIYIEKESE